MIDDALPSSPPLPDLVGGRYRIVSRLGVGGMGVVYKAIDVRLNRPVAVKALEDRRLLLPGSAGKLRTEALVAASLDHPYICKIYELVETATETYIVMEFVEGETLASLLKRGVLPLLQTLQFGREIAEGLANAHARGLVHRDVKPSNVMVTPHGHVKLLDFGVAGADVESTPGEQTRTITPQVTIHAGTPLYMAPEQAAGQPVSARADLFSLGVVLYECLTGALPFSGTTTFDYVRNMMQSAPRRLDRVAPDTPADLVDVIERCLEKSPAARPASADVVVAELRKLSAALTAPDAAVRTARHARSGRAWRIVAGLAVAAAMIAIGWQFLWSPASTGAPLRQLRPFVTSAAQEFGSQISPDSQWVSFIATGGGESQVMVQRVDGGEPRPLTLGQGTPISQTWSPDGKQLACVLKVDRTFLLQIYPAFFGGAPQQTVTLPERLSEVRLLRWIDRTIYFQVAGSDGISLRRLDVDRPDALATIAVNPTPGASLKYVDVSPDGRTVVAGVSVNSQEDLWVVGIDGSAPRALTADPSFERSPLWNGRGDRIVFQSNRGGQVDLWEIDPRTGNLTQLTSGEMEKIAESTSRDGSLISFQRLSQDAKLWAWGAADATGQQLTQDALSDYSPVLADDGRIIAFQRGQPTPSSGYAIVDAKLLVAPLERGVIKGAAQAIADGFAASLSDDGVWLAYLQPSDRAARNRLQVRHLVSGTTTMVVPYAEGPVLSSHPVDWASRMMTWTRTGSDLYFVDHPDVAAIRRYGAGQAKADPPLVRLTGPDVFIRDLYSTAGDSLLGYLTVSRDEVGLSVVTLASRASRTLATWRPGSLTGMYGRGWLGDQFILVRSSTLHENRSADIEVLSVDSAGTITEAGLITNAFIATTRLHAARRALYVTRIENGVHNLYEFAFATGALKPLTRNTLPGVTFSGFQPTGLDGLIGSRQERRQDIWLIQETTKDRRGNPAAR